MNVFAMSDRVRRESSHAIDTDHQSISGCSEVFPVRSMKLKEWPPFLVPSILPIAGTLNDKT